MRKTMKLRSQRPAAFAATALAAVIGMAVTLLPAAEALADIEMESASAPPRVAALPEQTQEAAPAAVEIKEDTAAPDAAKQQAAPKAEQKATAKDVKKPRKKEAVAKKGKSEKKEEVVVRTEPAPFLFGLFDARKPQPAELNEEQVQNDQAALLTLKKKPPKIDDRFKKVAVPFSGYQPGTVVIDTKNKFLYFVQSPVAAIRYGVAVGREGLQFTGKVNVGNKQVWPRWIPTKEMIARDPKQYAKYADGMDGGPDNPLGARAIYLYLGRNDTKLRIHGTNQPNSIGSEASNGCFRMLNEHVIDLYDKVKMGAQVVVI
jgi:lipoprotein-anchoring transpeptidase ErfK/SrfK